MVWHNRLLWPLRNSFMSMRGNALMDVSGGYLQHYGFGWGKSPYPEGFSRCWADYNHFRIHPESPWINDAGNKYKSIEEIRGKFGWEIHGEGKIYDPDRNDLTPESLGGLDGDLPFALGPQGFSSQADALRCRDQRRVSRSRGDVSHGGLAVFLLASGRWQLR